MVIVLLFRSAEKSNPLQELMKCRYVLFCFQNVGSHVSAACVEYTGQKATFWQGLGVEDM